MSAHTQPSTPMASTPWSRLLVAGLATAAGAAVTNALIYRLASVAGAMPQDIYVRPNQPITLGAVIGTTISSVIAAIGVLALLKRFTHRPRTIFKVVSAVVLVLSFATPFAIPNAPLAMIGVLEAMHVATAIITVFALSKAA